MTRKKWILVILAALLLAAGLSFGIPAMADSGPSVASVEEAADLLRESMLNREATISFTLELESEDYTEVGWEIWTEAMADSEDPRAGDYLYQNYMTMSFSYSAYASLFSNDYAEYTFELTYRTTAEQEAEMDAEIEVLKSAFNLYVDPFYRIQAIYDYVCSHVSFAETDSDYYHTGYAALMDGTAVCQGYTILLYRLLRECGINCRVMTGDTVDENGAGAHSWVIIEYNGTYYFTDATWDSTEEANVHAGYYLYPYFMQGYQDFDDFYTYGTSWETWDAVYTRSSNSWHDTSTYMIQDAVFEETAYYELVSEYKLTNASLTLLSNTWSYYDDAWHYADENGYAYCSGWAQIDGELYYFSPEGKMLTGEVEIDGVIEVFGEDGIWQQEMAS